MKEGNGWILCVREHVKENGFRVWINIIITVIEKEKKGGGDLIFLRCSA